MLLCICVSAALYHTIALLNEIRLLQHFIWRYQGIRVFYVISREISGVSGYVKGQGQGHQKHEMH